MAEPSAPLASAIQTKGNGAGPSPDGLRVIVCVEFDRRASPNEVSALKRTVIACPSVLHSVESSGAFDFMFEVAVPDMATYNERLNAVAGATARLVARYETSFIYNRFIRSDAVKQSIWVPCDEGMTRIECSVIDKVTAEGDYVRIHSQGRSWMLHATLRSMVQRLNPKHFFQIHRSAVVRDEFIDGLVHEGSRWVARLHDGTRETVAKSHVVSTLKRLGSESAKPRAGSSKRMAVTESSQTQ